MRVDIHARRPPHHPQGRGWPRRAREPRNPLRALPRPRIRRRTAIRLNRAGQNTAFRRRGREDQPAWPCGPYVLANELLDGFHSIGVRAASRLRMLPPCASDRGTRLNRRYLHKSAERSRLPECVEPLSGRGMCITQASVSGPRRFCPARWGWRLREVRRDLHAERPPRHPARGGLAQTARRTSRRCASPATAAKRPRSGVKRGYALRTRARIKTTSRTMTRSPMSP